MIRSVILCLYLFNEHEIPRLLVTNPLLLVSFVMTYHTIDIRIPRKSRVSTQWTSLTSSDCYKRTPNVDLV